jgi:signal transduction histidine kinase
MFVLISDKTGTDLGESFIKCREGKCASVHFIIESHQHQFTQKGSVVLTVNETIINSDQVQILIIVQDSGIGISESAIARLFTPFSQA